MCAHTAAQTPSMGSRQHVPLFKLCRSLEVLTKGGLSQFQRRPPGTLFEGMDYRDIELKQYLSSYHSHWMQYCTQEIVFKNQIITTPLLHGDGPFPCFRTVYCIVGTAREGVLTRECSERTRDNGFKLKERRFR